MLVLTLGICTPLSAQEELPTSEAQAFLGYWMITANLGGQEMKMGLEIGERATMTFARLVSRLGELDGEQLRKEGDHLQFDVQTQFGPFVVDLAIEGEELQGTLVQGGQQAAVLTGVGSDRVALSRFMIPADETRLEREGKMVRVRFILAQVEGPDYQRLQSLAPGEVASWVDFHAIKLTTELPIQVGGLDVPIENVTKDYPGVYSLWLQKTEGGWNLVFNHQADVWGTQHDPAKDHGTVPLSHETSEESVPEMKAALEEGEGGVRLQIAWGTHRWSVPVSVPGSGA